MTNVRLNPENVWNMSEKNVSETDTDVTAMGSGR